MPRLSAYITALISFTLLAMLVRPAVAHKVSIFAYVEGDRVFAEGYFMDGTKAKNSLIEVFDGSTGEKLLSTRTDENGRASFDIPRIAPLRLVITASMGHRNSYIIDEREIRGESEMEGPEAGNRKPEAGGQDTGLGVREAGDEELAAAVDRVIDRRLQPVMNILVRMEEDLSRPRITEIIGGIGYILGLMGIIMYFKSRKTK